MLEASLHWYVMEENCSILGGSVFLSCFWGVTVAIWCLVHAFFFLLLLSVLCGKSSTDLLEK